jgi:hypothetical protein
MNPLETLEMQQRIRFQDIAAGNESWICLDMNPNVIWIGAEEKVPCDCARRYFQQSNAYSVLGYSQRDPGKLASSRCVF